MRKFLTTIFAAAMAFGGVATTGPIASAAPVMPQVNIGDGASNLVQIQHRRWRRGGDWRRSGDWRDRGDWRGDDFRRHRRGGDGWYNGHRGYRGYRRGYRQHGDWWFPAGAFVAGAIIGGALSDPYPDYYAPRRIYEPQYAPRRIYRSGGSAHVRWCYNRYRSYRAWDNSFQPYDGPRQLCYSPYR